MENRFTLSVPAIARFLVPTRTEITSALGTFHINDWMCLAGSASADGVGFNSLADLGRQAQSLVSEARNLFSTIGNFFSSAASSVGKFFRGLFSPVALDLNGDGVQLTPASEGNKFYDMAGDGYQHLTAWTAAGDAILGYDACIN